MRLPFEPLFSLPCPPEAAAGFALRVVGFFFALEALDDGVDFADRRFATAFSFKWCVKNDRLGWDALSRNYGVHFAPSLHLKATLETLVEARFAGRAEYTSHLSSVVDGFPGCSVLSLVCRCGAQIWLSIAARRCRRHQSSSAGLRIGGAELTHKLCMKLTIVCCGLMAI